MADGYQRPNYVKQNVLTQDTKITLSAFNVHHRRTGGLAQLMRLTLRCRQAAVHWAEPLNDPAQQREIRSNEWSRCDNEGHSSITAH